jgi:hypothetical protein
MRASTLIQPYATAALTVKPFDNRLKPPPKGLIGQRIAIHAGAKLDEHDKWGLHTRLKQAWEYYKVDTGKEVVFHALPLSALLGSVLLRGYVSQEPDGEWKGFGIEASEVPQVVDSVWRAAGSKCVWVFGEARMLFRPIPMKGSQGWWHVPERHLAALEALSG